MNFNEARFCTLKLKEKDTLLVRSFYRMQYNDNIKLLDKIREKKVMMFYYLATSIFSKIGCKIMSTAVINTEGKELQFIKNFKIII